MDSVKLTNNTRYTTGNKLINNTPDSAGSDLNYICNTLPVACITDNYLCYPGKILPIR